MSQRTEAVTDPRRLSPEERQQELFKADRLYLDGEISLQEYQLAKRMFGTDYGAALGELAGLRRYLLRIIENIVSTPPRNQNGNPQPEGH